VKALVVLLLDLPHERRECACKGFGFMCNSKCNNGEIDE